MVGSSRPRKTLALLASPAVAVTPWNGSLAVEGPVIGANPDRWIAKLNQFIRVHDRSAFVQSKLTLLGSCRAHDYVRSSLGDAPVKGRSSIVARRWLKSISQP